MSKKKYFVRKQRMLFALLENFADVKASATQAGIDRATHYRWMNNDPEYKKEVRKLKEVTIDWNELRIMEYFRKTELKDIMFVLSKRGSHRGYSHYNYTKTGSGYTAMNAIENDIESTENQ